MLDRLLSRTEPGDSVAVIGLTRFGAAIAESLMALGHEVIGLDHDAQRVQEWSDHLTHVVQTDATSIDALRQLGIDRIRHVVVAIGDDLEASVLAVLALQELGVPDIWARAQTERHGKILERTGAHHVVYPEVSIGTRVAHLVSDRLYEFIEFDDGFVIATTCAPRATQGKTLAEADIHRRHGITVIGIKRHKEDFLYATPDTEVTRGDLLIVAGETRRVEQFAAGRE